MRWLLVCIVLFAGCVEPDGDSRDAATVHVLVIGGTVVEQGPAPESYGVCDIAPPIFSADNATQQVWWVEDSWSDAWKPAHAAVLVIRLDRVEQVADDGCWSYQLQTFDGAGDLIWQHADVQASREFSSTPSQFLLNSTPMAQGTTRAWPIEDSCWCNPYYDQPGQYDYAGDLQVLYLGAWPADQVHQLMSSDELPPLNVPFWGES